MIPRHRIGRLASALAIVVFVMSTKALACATCFGNPDSPMSKGVVAGVIVLFGVICFVLVGVAGISAFWIYRSRHLRANSRLEEGL